MNQYKNTVNTITHITKTPTHYKNPHIHTPTHYKTHTLQTPSHTHTHTPTHYKPPHTHTHTHTHIIKQVKTTTVQDTHKIKLTFINRK